MIFLVLLLVTFKSAVNAYPFPACQAAAVVDSPFIQASILSTGRLIMMKVRPGSGGSSTIAECSGKEGMAIHVLDAVRDDLPATCTTRAVYNPNHLNVTAQ
eukprot:Gregarina_sp_Poly_1__7909@NODE_4505_length_575_cov_883_527559_g3025_i0_p1_GENE_NODE_4505_length_575_cov_883_527559_g3025_i0NODE_4505_length_575_cov_883_527559_g3025_i0_p1_ORF_typecomplete_len101_score6_55_NODE_4505_length_575_cov_883_527559_g3025_i0123425